MTPRTSLESLCAAAFDVMRRAYAPYSGFRVGAALLGANGETFIGCNVENASYGGSICAERAAMLSAVAHGVRDVELLIIATEAAEPTPPCGACRQMLVEFSPRLEIVSCTAAGLESRWRVDELLPNPFTSHSLART